MRILLSIPNMKLLTISFICSQLLNLHTCQSGPGCDGVIYFDAKDVSKVRDDREYFYHTTARSVLECIGKCFDSQFCFSIGYSPSGQDSPAACLYSYQSAYNCSRRTLRMSHSDNNKEVVADCLKCPNLGQLITVTPSPFIRNLHEKSVNTPIVTETTPEPLVETTVTVSTSTSSIQTSTQPATTTERVDAVLSVRYYSVHSIAVHSYFTHVPRVSTAARCADMCSTSPGCNVAGFEPGKIDGLCLLSNEISRCRRDSKPLRAYSINEGRIIISCFTRASTIPTSLTSIRVFPTNLFDRLTYYSHTMKSVTAYECALLCQSDQSCKAAAFTPGAPVGNAICFLASSVLPCDTSYPLLKDFKLGMDTVILKCF